MAARAQKRTLSPHARATLIRVAASVTIFGVLVGGAIVAQGFDVKQTPLNDGSIWALQTIEGKRYARVNTDLNELDTVKSVIDPTELVQTESSVLVVAESNNKLANVSLSQPTDIASDSQELQDTPSGTRLIVSNQEFVGYLTTDGDVFAARIEAGGETQSVDPYIDEVVEEGEDRTPYDSVAIAIGTNGLLYSFSAEESSVLTYDLKTSKVVSQEDVANVPSELEATMTAVGDQWVLFDGNSGQTIGKSFAAVDTGIEVSGVLQQPSADGDRVYLSSPSGLVSLAISSGEITEEYTGADLGTPAAPAQFQNQIYAAWVQASAGTLWNSITGESELGYNAATLPGEADPAFRSNGSRMILNETSSGWVWTIPDGNVVPSSQDWTFGITEEQQTETDAEQATEVVEAKPPIAVDDQFGVRAGGLITLPVLLNDHDPNEDVLTIVPTSVGGLGGDFGTLSVGNNNQSVVIQVNPDATGTATFNYTITDGTRAGGLLSEPATVTVTVHDEKTNAAPIWCVDQGCQQDWFEDRPMQVQPGGSTTVRVLDNWVDPDGDAMFVSSVAKKDPKQIGKVASTPDGTVVFQHPNPSGTSSGIVNLIVTVEDVTGRSTERVLPVNIVARPQLSSAPFAETTRAGETLTVDPTPYLTGVTGAFSVTAASTGSEDGSKIALREGGDTFDFSAAKPGDYVVNYTVEDAATKLVSVVRITVIDNDAAQLTTAPVTIFLRPRLDSTVDVFSAVSNPAGRVLLISEATWERVNSGNLDVNIVDHRLLRVKGSTVDGKPGVVGVVTYTITDGTGTESGQVTGSATVILLDAPKAQAPIAVDDSVVVRVNEQVDIPVLENDVSGDGNSMVVNPDDLKNSSKKGLAFVSGSVVRYLAPEKAGTYEVDYGIYSAGSPKVADTATITVSVLPRGDNRAPQPRTLQGRVLAGETVTIPFDGTGLDPDGDDVILEKIVAQPKLGTAMISLSGDAIVYTSLGGTKGPVEFTYSVKDSFGSTATGKVRVGVLEDQSDPSPVTFSDYVEVQVGADSYVEVYPASNDIEPAGKDLKLVSVSPDASEADAAEYAALKSLIGDVTNNGVKLSAGVDVGTRTFEYVVENSTGDTAAGYITMKVVREAVPDRPRVSDTYVTLSDRSSFATGIDVVTGKVSWLSGDATTLKLSLWGDSPGMSVDGSKIKGELPEAGMLVPFQLTGENFYGTKVSTYGFLKIPGKDDIILALNGDATQDVKENGSVTFDMGKLIAVPTDETILLDTKNIPTTGQRADAACAIETGTRITYSAGKNEPWVDSCTVGVKLEGQKEFTKLLIPIVIEPGTPQPRLRPASRTLSPAGGPVEFDLKTMTEWQGKEDWDSLEFAAQYSGSQFKFAQNGDILTIEAEDAASPGQVEVVTVSLSSHKDVRPARITLKVGPAPTDLPRGATVNGNCSVDEGTSCTIKVIGGPGEFNVYDTPLKLASVQSASTCVDVKFSVQGDSVRAQFPRSVAGAKCTVSFVVEDVQGGQSSGEGNGTLNLDLFGYPSAPDAVEQATYDDGRVGLVVRPGDSANAYPDTTGFVIKDGNRTVAKCSVDGSCREISGLRNGDKRTYTAFAENSVGLSLTSVNTVAWSYAAPVLGDVTRTPVYSTGRPTTERSNGVVEVSITGTDDTVREYEVSGHQNQRRTGQTTTFRLSLPVGDQRIKIKPISQIDIPNGTGPSAGESDEGVRVPGLPSLGGPSGSQSTRESITVNGMSLDTNYSNKPSEVLYIAATGGISCYIDQGSGGGLTANYSGSGTISTSNVISGLNQFRQYNVKICASNGYGLIESQTFQKVTWGEPDAPAGYAYRIATTHNNGVYALSMIKGTAPEGIRTEYQGLNNGETSNAFGRDPGIAVRYCSEYSSSQCGDWKAVGAESGDRQWQMAVSVSNDLTWTCGEQPSTSVQGDGTLGNTTLAITGTYTNALGQPTEGNTHVGATRITGATATVTFAGPIAGLSAYTQLIGSGTFDCEL